LKAVCRKLDGVTILQKGAVDLISDGEHLLRCDVEGGPRRSGGLGDILAGTLGIVSAWSSMAARTASDDASGVVEPGAAAGAGAASVAVWAGKEQLWAALAACSITRSSCGAAFAKEKRATTVHTSPLPPHVPPPSRDTLA
jgi:ATP-dependent NAD(P)H-hydrate dehydratase